MAHVIFFDGVCNLCNNSVDFVFSRDVNHVFRYASLQSNYANSMLKEKGIDNGSLNTIILIKNGRVFSQSAAILEILRDLPFPWPLLYIFKLVPEFIRDSLYKLVSANRYKWFGKRNTCRVPLASEQAYFMQETD